MYTTEERTKIHENLDKIKEYLDGLRPNVRDAITVDFGPMKTYANFDRELAYHITIDRDEIRGRSGGLVLDYTREDVSSSTRSTVYQRLDYAVALIQNWYTIKETINTALQDQKQKLEDINNFEI
jgi:hypothetical protein